MKVYKGIAHTCGWGLYGDSGYGPQDARCGACKVAEMDAEDRAEAEELAKRPFTMPTGPEESKPTTRYRHTAPVKFAFDGPWNSVG